MSHLSSSFRMADGRQKGIRWLKQKTRQLIKHMKEGYNLYNKYNIKFTNAKVAI